MTNLKERIKEARQNAGLTQPQLAESVGVSRRTIVNYEKDASNASVEIVQKIASKCGVDEIWLLTGKGTMLESHCPDNVTKVVVEHQDLVSRFKDPERAKKFNEFLIEIEEDDPEGYDELYKEARSIAKTIKRLKKTPTEGEDLQDKSTA